MTKYQKEMEEVEIEVPQFVNLSDYETAAENPRPRQKREGKDRRGVRRTNIADLERRREFEKDKAEETNPQPESQ